MAGPTAYGRVDLVPRADGTPAVLELELVEPALFLSYSVGAAERFAAVLRSQAGDG
jgi:O-ureido-D-serine cyclo-ligase